MVGAITCRHAEGKRGDHHYVVDARFEPMSVESIDGARAGTNAELATAAGGGGKESAHNHSGNKVPNARLGALRCDIRGAKDEDAKQRAVSIACSCSMTPAFARACARAVARGAYKSGNAKTRTRACIAKRRNDRVGVEYWVVVACTTEGDKEEEDYIGARDRTMSFRIENGADDDAKRRATAFTASAAFDAWASGSKCVPGPKDPGLGGSLVRAKKHAYSYSGIMGDDIIDCACGDNEEYGFMVACETCGAWEHGVCCQIYSEKEIPQAYKCSACVRLAEKAFVVLEYSTTEDKSNSQLRTAPRPVRPPESYEIEDDGFGTIDGVASLLQEERIVVCCICGCEDCDGGYGKMVRACSCDNGGAIAHESCMKDWVETSEKEKESEIAGGRSRAASRSTEVAVKCKVCGDAGGKASGVADPSHVDEMLKAFGKAIEDTSARYEAEAKAYRANPKTSRKNTNSERKRKEKPKEPKSENKVRVEKKRASPVAEDIPDAKNNVTTPAEKSKSKVEKFANTPVSMLPLKKRRMMAWDSEQKLRQV